MQPTNIPTQQSVKSHFYTQIPYQNQILLSIKNSKRVINLAGTKYPIIKQTAIQQLNFQPGIDFYTFLWTDHHLSIRQIRQLQQFQRVNHFPEITEITRKNKLGRNLNSMQSVLPRDYNFYPETFMLPSDYQRLLKRHQKGKFYIVKPQNGSQGKGIYLIDNPNKLLSTFIPTHQTSTQLISTSSDRNTSNLNNQIVQQYIDNPLLIDGLKFDLRIYVLITSITPLRMYLYKEGIARFATQKFQKAKIENLLNTYSHLTNYAINKNHQEFKVDDDGIGKGHKRLFSGIFRVKTKVNNASNSETSFKSEENQSKEQKKTIYQTLLEEIGDIAIKTVISALPSLQNAFNQCKRLNPNSCFQLLGFDILLTSSLKPILLEVNQNPSLSTDTSLDKSLKSSLIKDILQLVSGNLSPSSDQKFQTLIKNKDRYQMANLGNFIRIYPCEDLQTTEKYDTIINKSQQVYRGRFGINVIRNVKTNNRKEEEKRNQNDSFVQWNEVPGFYSKEKLSKVYGTRASKTSQVKRRAVFF